MVVVGEREKEKVFFLYHFLIRKTMNSYTNERKSEQNVTKLLSGLYRSGGMAFFWGRAPTVIFSWN